ncbi:MAG: acetylglutamate kinase [Bacteroidota bacterium]
MNQIVSVVKIGGAVLEDTEKRAAFLHSFASLSSPKILVHGGGRRATDIATKLGIEAPMIKGRRITSLEMMEVALMVYGGLVNKTLVAQLQSQGMNAIGLTGADLNVILAHKRPVTTIDYGLAGDIDQVNSTVLKRFLQQDQIPVMAPITHDGQGQLLNTNADTIATEVAIALSGAFEVRLILAFEKKGVLANADDDHSVISPFSLENFEVGKKAGSIVGGMIPKLSNGFRALEKGVAQVQITRYDSLDFFSGTQLHLSRT